MNSPSSSALSRLRPASYFSPKYLGVFAVAVGIYQSHRIYTSDTTSAMTIFQDLINAFLNFLDKDRPCNLLYEEAMQPRGRDKTPEEMKKSLAKFEEALKKCRPKNPRKHDLHNDYGVTIYTAFVQDLQYRTSDMMDRAVAQMKEARECWPASEKISTDYANFETDFGNIYVDRYMAFKNVTDLGNALEVGQAALNSCPPGALRERVLALLLRGRAGCAYNKSFGSPTAENLGQPIKDLNDAIQLCEKDEDLKAHIPTFHYNLNIAYTIRYKVTHQEEDLTQAIIHGDKAAMLPEGHPDKPSCLVNLAEVYGLKYKAEMETKSYKDPVAVEYIRKAMELVARAKETGNDPQIIADCEKMEGQIQEFRRNNTYDVLAPTTGQQHPSPHLDIPKFDEPEPQLLDSAVSMHGRGF